MWPNCHNEYTGRFMAQVVKSKSKTNELSNVTKFKSNYS